MSVTPLHLSGEGLGPTFAEALRRTVVNVECGVSLRDLFGEQCPAIREDVEQLLALWEEQEEEEI